jgi:glycosyltransferase involved in cell wall biosynthesis
MKIAIVSESPCYPPTAGNRIRTLNLMLPLARRHELTYFCRTGDAAEARQAREFLQDHDITPVIVEEAPPRKSGLGFLLRLGANLFSSVPFSVAANNSGRLRQAIRDHAAQQPVDLWQFEWLAYADAVPPHPAARKVIIAHDIVSLLWQRHHQTETSPLKRWYIRRQWRKFARYERRVFHEATRVVAVSAEDAALAQRLYELPCIDVVENGVDNAYFAEVSGERDPRRILFVGTLESRPNLDAVHMLLERIFPAVRAQVPEARLVVVGRNPPPSLSERVKGCAGVELHGSVPDVRPYFGQCGLLAVPLRIAGGSRIKILEALSAGLPVVSTRVGAEGLNLDAGRDLVVVEDIDGMADALVAAVRHPEPLGDMARRGRQVVHAQYDWTALAERLERVWEQCVRTQRTAVPV